MSNSSGELFFSRYACSPNELGYCGPEVADAFTKVASGHSSVVNFRQAASEFSGVWVYLEILGEMLGRDPLDEELVRGYWVGNDLVDSVDRDNFWDKLNAVISARAGSYWKYLDESLRAEATPTHSFHVLGIYPWTRLLTTGRPEPLEVINSCCIKPAVVLAVNGSFVDIEEQSIQFDGQKLSLAPVVLTTVEVQFNLPIEVGDHVAVHWGKVCDSLSSDEYLRLQHSLSSQVDYVSERLAASL